MAMRAHPQQGGARSARTIARRRRRDSMPPRAPTQRGVLAANPTYLEGEPYARCTWASVAVDGAMARLPGADTFWVLVKTMVRPQGSSLPTWATGEPHT